jgi:alanine racemase
LQVLRCRERTRDLSTALTTSVNGKSYASHLHGIYAEFQTNHRERKVRHALELVKKLEAAVHAAELGYKSRISVKPNDTLNRHGMRSAERKSTIKRLCALTLSLSSGDIRREA